MANQTNEILKNIKKGNLKPIYLLMGNEPYFINQVSKCIEQDVLKEEEKEFDQTVLYGADTDISTLIAIAKSYPTVSQQRVIVLKQAQKLTGNIDLLANYVSKPIKSTILVICYNDKPLDKRKKLYKEALKTGIVLESQKLYDNQIPLWIKQHLESLKYKIDEKSIQILAESLGSDLHKIANELKKLSIILPEKATITPSIIEKHIGISKDYNNFELRRAFSENDEAKIYKICQYFSQNEKNNPFVLTISQLHNFFSQVFKFHGLNDVSDSNASKVLGINPFFIKEIRQTTKNYPPKRVSAVLEAIRYMDCKSKGIGGSVPSQLNLLQELAYQILSKRAVPPSK